jgi:hypothetical protein
MVADLDHRRADGFVAIAAGAATADGQPIERVERIE